MKSHRAAKGIVIAALALAAPFTADAAIVNLHGTASGDTAYYEYFSDSFFRMDLVELPPNEHQQRFHLISNPSTVIGSAAFDGFVNDNAFRIGSLQYDESGLVAGNGTAPITGVTLGIGADPSNPAYINFGRWTDITTIVNTFTGTVDVLNGQPVSISLTSTITVTAFFGNLNAVGTFNISGNQFDGFAMMPGGAAWDFAGTLPAVPAPATLPIVMAGAALACGRGRRRCSNK